MISSIENVQISAICAAVPKKSVGISEYMNGFITEKEARRLSKNTGFSHLRISDEYAATSDLCFTAAVNIFDKCNIGREDIDAIVFVSQTPDYLLPSTSHILQDRLGLSEDLIAIDVNQGCSGYVYGLYLSALMVSASKCRNVLLLAGDTIAKLTDENDRATRAIFGDAGSATIISRGEDRLSFQFQTMGKDYGAIIVENSGSRRTNLSSQKPVLYLDGMKILNFALEHVPPNILKLLNHIGVDPKDIDLFACHQANKLILRSLAEKLEINEEKVPFTADKIGNTSSASIPLLLATSYHEKCKNKYLKKVVVCGFGVGLSIAVGCVDLSNTTILEMVEL